jgi:hypothetical protein
MSSLLTGLVAGLGIAIPGGAVARGGQPPCCCGRQRPPDHPRRITVMAQSGQAKRIDITMSACRRVRAASVRDRRSAQRTTSPIAAYRSMWAWPLWRAYSSIILTSMAPRGRPCPCPGESSVGSSAIAASALSTSAR